jgi:nicotinamidase-related amidase
VEYVEPDPDGAVLLTIDTQNEFKPPDCPAEVEGTAEAVPQIQRLVEGSRAADAPIDDHVRG